MKNAILNFDEYEFPVGEGISIGEWTAEQVKGKFPEKLKYKCFRADVYKKDVQKSIGKLEAIVKGGKVICITAFIDGFDIQKCTYQSDNTQENV